jgi:hypothetical protein
MESERFNDLPFELQEHIISQKPELIQLFSRLNPVYNELLKPDLFKNVCNRDFSQSESNEAYFKQLTSAYLFQSVYGPDDFLLILEVRVRNIFNERNTILTVVKYTNGNVIFSDKVDDDYQNFRYTMDSLSRYNMLSNRLNCMSINPNFAKYNTINDLNDIIDVYEDALDDDSHFLIFYIFNLYMTCLMNVYVFNIIVDFDITLLEDITNNLTLIRQDINRMLKLISDKILLL